MLPLCYYDLLYPILNNTEKICLWMQTSSNPCLFIIMLSVTSGLNYPWGIVDRIGNIVRRSARAALKTNMADGKVEKTAEWLAGNQFHCSLTVVHNRGWGRKAWVTPTTSKNCGWLTLAKGYTPTHTLPHSLQWSSGKNRRRKLVGQDKDRENISQLLLWVKKYLLIIRMNSGSEKKTHKP